MPDIVHDGPSLTPRGPTLPEVIVEDPEKVPDQRTRPQGELEGGKEAVLARPGLFLILDH